MSWLLSSSSSSSSSSWLLPESDESDEPSLSSSSFWLAFGTGALTVICIWCAHAWLERHLVPTGGAADFFMLEEEDLNGADFHKLFSGGGGGGGNFMEQIGELPRRIQRKLWPWRTLRRHNKSTDSSGGGGGDDNGTATEKKNRYDDDEKENEKGNQSISRSTSENEEKSGFCIGGIFGLDVGGTLAKLVYFEEVKPQDNNNNNSNHEKMANNHSHHSTNDLYNNNDAAAPSRHARHSSSPFVSAGAGVRNVASSEADLQSLHALAPETSHNHKHHYHNHTRKAATAASAGGGGGGTFHKRMDPSESRRDLRKSHSEEFRHDHQQDLPTTNGDEKATDQSKLKFPTNKSSSSNATKEKTATSTIGKGKMPKVQSCYDFFSSNKTRDREEALDRFYNFAKHLETTLTREAFRDHKLRFYSRELGGYFHFLHFETRRMKEAIDLIRKHNLQRNIREMGATGGGAHKFALDFENELAIQMKREGELESLVAGMQFVLSTVVGECYTFRPPNEQHESMKQKNKKVQMKDKEEESDESDYGDYFGVTWANGYESCDSSDAIPEMPEEKAAEKVDEWWWSRKVQRDAISYSSSYPYLVVTIGTGVSILRVDGPRKHERISGSTIGGGTYWGLIRLLTSFEEFDDVIRLAERGDPSKVDMMVGDIYGGNSDALERLGLRADLVASSFGKLVAKEEPAEGLTEEDLARALLLMVTNNIGQVAYLNAELHKTERIYFVGNFLRQNRLSQRRLAFAIDYWSKGKMEALFLEHEGYFGALGAFLLSQNIPHQQSSKGLKSQHSTPLPEDGKPQHRHHLKRRQTMEGFSFSSSSDN